MQERLRAIFRRYGLPREMLVDNGSPWGSDREQLSSVAQRLEAGTVFINKHADTAPHVPFGGIKCSGLGVEFGEEGLAAYTTIKIINAAA